MRKRKSSCLFLIVLMLLCLMPARAWAAGGPIISSQPNDVTVLLGNTAYFGVTASGTNLSYQWEYRISTNSPWNKATAAGNTSRILEVPGTWSRNGYQYRCKVSNSSGSTYSSAATLHINLRAPSILTQPANTTVAEGGSAVFTVKAQGDRLNYRWQYRENSSGTWTDSVDYGAATNGLELKTVSYALNGYQYRCRIKNATNSAIYSNVVTLTVTPAKPVITSHPSSAAVTEGTTVKFKVTASGSALTYQWQFRTSSSGTWAKTAATGNKTATLSVPGTLSRNGYQYRCVVKNPVGTVYSKAATLNVEEAISKPVIKTQPVSVQIKAGQTAKFTVTAEGKNLTYQWQYRTSANGSWTKSNASGSQTATVSVSATNSRNGYQYRCIVKNSAGTVNSSAATMTVIPEEPTLMSGPEDTEVNEGETAVFYVDADGYGLSYQWQYRPPTTSSWSKATAEGNQTATLRVPGTMSRSGYQYRCIITNAGGELITNPAVLTVLPKDSGKPVITKQADYLRPDPSNFNYVILTVEASGDNLTYQWQYRNYPDDEWTNLTSSGSSTPDLEISPIITEYWDEEMEDYYYSCSNDGRLYRCKISNSAGTVYSNSTEEVFFDWGE